MSIGFAGKAFHVGGHVAVNAPAPAPVRGQLVEQLAVEQRRDVWLPSFGCASCPSAGQGTSVGLLAARWAKLPTLANILAGIP